jgi:nucleoside-diphosphate-sugar epimerase
VKAFVTGATGFVGSHLADVLVALGVEVVALARRPATAEALAQRGIAPAQGSLEDEAALRAALEGADIVYHVAGLTSGSEAELFEVNEAGTARLLSLAESAAGGAAPRFVHVSSAAALGPSPRGVRLAEDAVARPITRYGRSKLAGEQRVTASSLAWTIVRPPAVYGPRDREFLNLFRTVRTGIAPLFGSGTQELSLVFVVDLARAIARAGLEPSAAGQVLHVAHSEVVLSRDVARAAAAAVGKRPLLVPLPGMIAGPLVTLAGAMARAAGIRTVLGSDKVAELLAPSWLLDTTRAEGLLGWRAETDLVTGMRRTAAWYRESGWL